MTTKRHLSTDYARKAYAMWTQVNDREAREGRPTFDVEWMLSIAWKQGFESGQRHQIKVQKAKLK